MSVYNSVIICCFVCKQTFPIDHDKKEITFAKSSRIINNVYFHNKCLEHYLGFYVPCPNFDGCIVCREHTRVMLWKHHSIFLDNELKWCIPCFKKSAPQELLKELQIE